MLELLKFILEDITNFFGTIGLIFTIGITVSGIIDSIKGK